MSLAVGVADVDRDLERVEDALERRLVAAADVAAAVAGRAEAAEGDVERRRRSASLLLIEDRRLDADAGGAEADLEADRLADRDASPAASAVDGLELRRVVAA